MNTVLLLLKKNLVPLIGIFVYGLVGVCVIAIALYVYERVVGCNIREELKDRNFSVGITVAALVLGMSLIVMAAIRGRADNAHVGNSDSGCGGSTTQTTQQAPL